MGCASCGSGGCGSSAGNNGEPKGCRSNNGCSTGGCNKLNVYNWLSDLPFSAEQDSFKIVEVSFKNGSHKSFYRNTDNLDVHTGDTVVVEVPSGGYSIGRISLSGELVRLQMRKRRVKDNADIPRLLRRAGQADLERWKYAREQEYPSMLMARVISRQLGLNMKIGDVEYQGDGRKATFYYTADERVDFRELIRLFAKEFRVKIEMRQIGARQEASRVGGIGSCGRELCCSTWLTDFKSVSTVAARYQNLAINQAKLSGQCGRLKCCLNYELDTYIDALKEFPKNVEFLETEAGSARLVKTDIFKRKMWYAIKGSNAIVPLNVKRVFEIQAMNREGVKPAGLMGMEAIAAAQKAAKVGFEDGVGELTLNTLEKTDKRKKDKERRKRRRKNRKPTTNSNTGSNVSPTNTPTSKPKPKTNPRPKGKPNPRSKQPTNSKKTTNQKNTNPKSKTNPRPNPKPTIKPKPKLNLNKDKKE